MTTEFNHQSNFIELSKRLFSVALPMAVTQLITMGSGFLCMVMMAKLGRDVLAASALIFSIRISVLIIGASILFSLSMLIGRAYGEKEYLRIGNFMQQGWLVGAFISIPIMLIFWHIDTILTLFGQPKPSIQIAQLFFHANIWNVAPFLLSICNQQLCYGTRKQKLDLMANLIGVIVLLISAYLFILGKFGFPQLGVKGLAYAMNLQGWFYFLFTSYIIFSSDHFKRFSLFNFRIKQNWHCFIKMFNIGWPIFFQMGGEMLSFAFTTTMVGWLGMKALAAYQVIIQYVFLVIIPLFALSQASGVLISHACGEEKFHEVKNLGHASILFSLIITVIVMLIFLLIPKELAAIYLNIKDTANAEIVHLIILLFAITAISQIFDGIRNVLTGMLRGLFDTRFPMLAGLLAIWLIGIPLGYFLAFILKWGVVGIAIGSACGMLVGMLFLIYRWHKLNKKYSLLHLQFRK